MDIIFPATDREARANGDVRSASSKSKIVKGVSKDLSSLAPRVENFLDNLNIDMNMLNSMLEDQMNTGDSWRDVTCRWLQSNEEIWQSWLPDDTTCFGGFGLYGDVTNQFAADRTVREGKRRGYWCRRQRFVGMPWSLSGSQKHFVQVRHSCGQTVGFGCVLLEVLGIQGEWILRCQACPSGMFSKQLIDSDGVTYICEQCPMGTSQASGAQLRHAQY